jgi:nicotinamide-nucleotide amidase
MEYLVEHVVLPYVKQKFDLKGTIKAKVLHVAGIGESQVDEWIGDLETYHNPTVGLLAHPGQVDIRVTAKANSIDEADRLIEEVVEVIYQRLGEAIFGTGFDTLEDVILKKIASQGWNLLVIEAGLDENLLHALKRAHFPEDQVIVLPQGFDKELRSSLIAENIEKNQADVILLVDYQPGAEKQSARIEVTTPLLHKDGTFFYGGPPASGLPWAVNMGLDFLRRNLS